MRKRVLCWLILAIMAAAPVLMSAVSFAESGCHAKDGCGSKTVSLPR